MHDLADPQGVNFGFYFALPTLAFSVSGSRAETSSIEDLELKAQISQRCARLEEELTSGLLFLALFCARESTQDLGLDISRIAVYSKDHDH